MKALKFKNNEHGQRVEIWFLGKEDRKGWAPREDGSFRYMSVGLGTVIITDSPSGAWYWEEYDANDPRVTETLELLFKFDSWELVGNEDYQYAN